MEAEVAIDKVQQNIAQRQQLEPAYRQTYEAIVALFEFAPPFVGAFHLSCTCRNSTYQTMSD